MDNMKAVTRITPKIGIYAISSTIHANISDNTTVISKPFRNPTIRDLQIERGS
jgi:hypothetical protein